MHTFVDVRCGDCVAVEEVTLMSRERERKKEEETHLESKYSIGEEAQREKGISTGSYVRRNKSFASIREFKNNAMILPVRRGAKALSG